MSKSNNKPIDLQKTFLNKHAEIAYEGNKINPALYSQYNVKRGLRNADGTGVLVGLTEIGEVHGYIVDESEKVPVDGILRYRGIDVGDITDGFQKSGRLGFEETVYLLLFGELPTNSDLSDFNEILDFHRQLPVGFVENMILKAPSSNIMNKLARSVLVSYSYDLNPESRTIKNVLRQCLSLIAQFPCMIAYGYQAKAHYHDDKSLRIHHPEPGMSTAENFLRLIRHDKEFTRTEAEILDLAMVLHAEHGGGNNSSFTTHVVTSSDTDTYSAIAAAVGSLKGLKHGGANIKVVDMMEDFKSNIKDWSDDTQVGDYITRVIKKEACDKTGLVYGMGHAVYTLSDPRAIIFKEKVEQLAKEKGCEDELKLYKAVERLTPQIFSDVKGSDKVISANVDFYSGFVYRILGIPTELFTPIFAMSRIAGWSAHILEELVSGGRIMRPAYKNVRKRRAYTAISER